MYGIFRRHCTNVQFDDKVGDFRGCLTDEHVWASLFAYYNKAKETDCLGVITIADFTNSVEVSGCCNHCQQDRNPGMESALHECYPDRLPRSMHLELLITKARR